MATDGLGRWGVVVNAFAVLYGVAMIVNLAWPRAAVYGSDHWYFQWGAVVFTVLIAVIGAVLLLVRPHWMRLPATPAAEEVS